jgi:hypothetical protein
LAIKRTEQTPQTPKQVAKTEITPTFLPSAQDLNTRNGSCSAVKPGTIFKSTSATLYQQFVFSALSNLRPLTVSLARAELNRSTTISPLSLIIMTDRRPEDQEMSSTKRIKTERNMDPASNPYLAHQYNGNGNGYASKNTSPLAHFERHNTSAQQAHIAEDSPNNPFNGTPLSSTYFSILKTRRDLPVHKQRLVLFYVGNSN